MTIRPLCVVASFALAAACHRQAPASESAPIAVSETACWWSVYRTGLPVNAVAVRLVDAFSTLGLTDAKWEKQGDTVWASAGPTRLAARFGGTYSVRAVAFQRGDSTLYRYFVTAAPPPGGWRRGYDSVTVNGGHISVVPASSAIGLCAAVASTAQNGGRAPKVPNGEETLAVWSSRPASAAAADRLPPSAVPPLARSQLVTTYLPRPIEPADADSIVLERTPCFGVCPPYRLRIAKSGAVLYQSRAAGDTTPSVASIPADEAHRLFERADLLRFAQLPDTIANERAYCGVPPSDYPSAIITIFAGSASKHVVDDLGCDWAPVGLRQLEGMIDSVAGTQRLRRPSVVPRPR